MIVPYTPEGSVCEVSFVVTVLEEAMELLSYRSHQCPLCFPGSSHFGRLRASLGPGLGLLPKGFYFAPFPRSALVGLASPGGFGSGRSALGAPLPVRLPPPLFFLFSNVLVFLFCDYVRLALGQLSGLT